MTNQAHLNPLLAALARRRQAEQAKELAKAEQLNQDYKGIPLAPFKQEEVNSDNLNSDTTSNNLNSNAITLNQEQLKAVDLARQGQSFCLIGAAGTGKTTTLKEVAKVIKELLGTNFNDESLVLCAYTNRAVRNLSNAVKDLGFESHCKTIHKWLEYSPVYYEVETINGDFKNTMRFEPRRTEVNPLDARIVVIDEASMVEPELFNELKAACPEAVFIFVGDINQIPPVFGLPILGYMLNKLEVVELKTVYRQALESPIIWFQHNYTLLGKIPTDYQIEKMNEEYKDKGLTFKPFNSEGEGYVMAEAVANYMFRNYKQGLYDFTQDTILIPYNKSFGSIHLNLHLANLLGKDRGATVYEVISGFDDLYLAVDDFVMYDKKECIITSIEPNKSYFGKLPVPPSKTLNRFGTYEGNEGARFDMLDTGLTSLNLDGSIKDLEQDDKVRQGSHIVTLKDIQDGTVYNLSSSGDLNSIEYGYAMTVHKSQGSEWRKVWFILCRQHKAMLSREILYTGMTRAKESLEVIYTKQTMAGRRNSSIARAIANPRFAGTTWQQKAQRFNVKDLQED